MLGRSYFIWKDDPAWFERYDWNEDDGSHKIRLTDKAPPEAVESFERYKKKMEESCKQGIVY